MIVKSGLLLKLSSYLKNRNVQIFECLAPEKFKYLLFANKLLPASFFASRENDCVHTWGIGCRTKLHQPQYLFCVTAKNYFYEYFLVFATFCLLVLIWLTIDWLSYSIIVLNSGPFISWPYQIAIIIKYLKNLYTHNLHGPSFYNHSTKSRLV